jgi:hypothetical protein
MNSRIKGRDRRPARLLTALLTLTLIVGTASVAQAQEISSMVITAKRPVHCDFNSMIRDEMHADTKITVWLTRIDVGTDLGIKLGRPNRKYQVATNEKNKRG